jgi:hypothetical protein
MTRRKPEADTTPAVIILTEDRFSAYFHGAEKVLRAAVRRVGCKYMFDPSTRRLSVPKQFADEVAVAVETCGGRIADRGLW